MKNRIVLIAIIGLLMFPLSSSAQKETTFTVKGQIYSLIDQLPMPGVEVFLKNTEYSAVTGDDGIFRIQGVPRGIYDVMAKYPDADALILKDVAVPPSMNKEFVFNLMPTTPSIPYETIDTPADLGLLSGTVAVKIDTFRSDFNDGRLMLKATKVGNITEAFIYPVTWSLLPVVEQDFRFLFNVPKGEKYRLFLVWQNEHEKFIDEQIVEVAREARNSDAARIFDLTELNQINEIRIQFDARKIEIR